MRTPALPAHPLPIQGALPAAPCTPQPPKVSVGEREPFLFPMGRDGAAGVRGIPTSASAQPWGTSLTLKHHPRLEHDASLSDWTCSYSSCTQTEHVYLKNSQPAII